LLYWEHANLILDDVLNTIPFYGEVIFVK